MGSTVKFLLFLCAIPTFRAHTHGIRLIIILALAYLLQQGYKKGNKKPKTLWKRSAGDLFNSADDSLESEEPPHVILQHALDMDIHECAQLAVCRMGMREARGEKLSENESVLLSIIFRNGSEPSKSKGEEAFQKAVEYGRQVYRDEKLCQLRHKQCPHRDKAIDSFLRGNGMQVT